MTISSVATNKSHRKLLFTHDGSLFNDLSKESVILVISMGKIIQSILHSRRNCKMKSVVIIVVIELPSTISHADEFLLKSCRS